MRLFKRLAGVLATLLGGVGVLVCLVGLVAVWVARARVDAAISTIVERIDVALSTVEQRAQQANERIDNTRDDVDRLNQRVQLRMAELQDVPAEQAADIDEIERQVYARLQLSTDWIEFMRSSMELVDQFLQTLNSTALIVQGEPSTLAGVMTALRASHEEIQETSRLADALRVQLKGIRAQGDVEARAEQIETLSSRIDASLERVQQLGDKFETAIGETRTGAAELGSRIHRRILIATITANLLLIWLALSQACLAVRGWHFVRPRAST